MRLQNWTIAVAAPSAVAAAAVDQECVPGLHMIVARGSLEPPGEGTLGTVAGLVASQIPELSTSIGVNYPAGLNPYKGSVVNGTEALTNMVKEYEEKCPKTKIALLGYSQGAQVVGNTLCGTSSAGWKPTPPLNQKYAENIVAVVLTGDPTFIPGLPYDAGTSTKHGKFPRRNIKACHPYAHRIQSYCDKNDIYCASGNSLAVHLSYTAKYAAQAAAFIVKSYSNPPPLNPFGSNHPAAEPGSPSHGASPSPSGKANTPHNDGGRSYESRITLSMFGVFLAVVGQI